MSDPRSQMSLNHEEFARAGLNLLAVLPITALPVNARESLGAAGHELARYRQLLLVGHGGKALWRQIQAAGPANADPVDTYTLVSVKRLLDAVMQAHRYAVVYPGGPAINLQHLGALAGWHHPTPFWVGINARYGTWFAYRALVLADSDFALTEPWPAPSPCIRCDKKPCLSACPADALASGSLELARCIEYRRQPESRCRHQCVARNACPVGLGHRYDGDQMRHHYAASLAFIEAMPQPPVSRESDSCQKLP